MSPAVFVQISIWIAGVVAQLIMFAFFMGKIRAEQTNLAREVEAFKKTVEAFQAFQIQNAGSTANLVAKLENLGGLAEMVDKMRIEFAEERATAKAEREAVGRTLDQLRNGVTNAQAQLAHLGRAGAQATVERALSGGG